MSPLALDRWPPSGHLQLACLFSFLVLFLDRLTKFVCVFLFVYFPIIAALGACYQDRTY